MWGEWYHYFPQLLQTNLSLVYPECGRAGLSFHSQMSYGDITVKVFSQEVSPQPHSKLLLQIRDLIDGHQKH